MSYQFQSPTPTPTPQSAPPAPQPTDDDTVSMDEAIEKLRVRFGIPKVLADKLIRQESGGNDSAKSYVGATGRMQLMPSTARGILKPNGQPIDPNNPLENVYGGFKYLSDNYKTFRGRANSDRHAWAMALGAYHAGPQAVEDDLKKGGVGIPDRDDGLINTQDYVYNILGGTKPEDFAVTETPQQNIDAPVAPNRQRDITQQPTTTPQINLRRSVGSQAGQVVGEAVNQPQKSYVSSQPRELSTEEEQRALQDVHPDKPTLQPYDPEKDLSLPAKLARRSATRAGESVFEQMARSAVAKPSNLLGTVTFEVDGNKQPTDSEIVDAFMDKLGNGWKALGEKYRQETGREPIDPRDIREAEKGGDYLPLTDRRRYVANTTQDFIDTMTAYSEGGLDAARRVATERAKAGREDTQNQKSIVAATRAAMKQAGLDPDLAADIQTGLMKTGQGTAQLAENLRKVHEGLDPTLEDENQRVINESRASMPAFKSNMGAVAGTGLEVAGDVSRMGATPFGPLVEQFAENINRGGWEAAKSAGTIALLQSAGIGADRLSLLAELSPAERQVFVRAVQGDTNAALAAAQGEKGKELLKAFGIGAAFPVGSGERVEQEPTAPRIAPTERTARMSAQDMPDIPVSTIESPRVVRTAQSLETSTEATTAQARPIVESGRASQTELVERQERAIDEGGPTGEAKSSVGFGVQHLDAEIADREHAGNVVNGIIHNKGSFDYVGRDGKTIYTIKFSKGLKVFKGNEELDKISRPVAEEFVANELKRRPNESGAGKSEIQATGGVAVSPEPAPVQKQLYEMTRQEYENLYRTFDNEKLAHRFQRQLEESRPLPSPTVSGEAGGNVPEYTTIREGDGFKVGPAFNHGWLVERALSEGKPVPPEVLVDYPDLRATSAQPPLPEVGDNFRRPLKDFTPKLYRETSPSSALEIIPTSGVSTDLTSKDVFFSNTPDLALGQGRNRGVLLEFESKDLQGKVNTRKPAWDLSYQQGSAELIGRLNKQSDYQSSLRSVTVRADAKYEGRGQQRRFESALVGLENEGWTKSVGENGDRTYTRPKQAEPLEPAPVQQSNALRARKADVLRSEGGSLADYDRQVQAEWLGKGTRFITPVPDNGRIKVYRATPEGYEIQDGDYVTTSKAYAEYHIESNLGGEGKITEREVGLDEIYPADAPSEFWFASKQSAASKSDSPTHHELQPRRQRNVATGTRGQFKSETKGQREARQAQMSEGPPIDRQRYQETMARGASKYGIDNESDIPSPEEAYQTFKDEYAAVKTSVAEYESQLQSGKRLRESARRSLEAKAGSARERLAYLEEHAENLFGERAAKEITGNVGRETKQNPTEINPVRPEGRQVEVGEVSGSPEPPQPRTVGKASGQGEEGAGKEEIGSPHDIALSQTEKMNAKFVHEGPDITEPLKADNGQQYIKERGFWFFSNDGGANWNRITSPESATQVERWAQEKPAAQNSGAGQRKERTGKEKVNAKTGLDRTQTNYLAGELEKVADKAIEEGIGEGAKSGREIRRSLAEEDNRFPKEHLTQPLAEPVTIKVPDDGEFTIMSGQGANRLHQKITGKPIEGFERAQGTGLHRTRVSTALSAKEKEANTDVDEVILAYGGAQKAYDGLLKVQQQLAADPEAAEQIGGDRERLEGLLNELKGIADAQTDLASKRSLLNNLEGQLRVARLGKKRQTPEIKKLSERVREVQQEVRELVVSSREDERGAVDVDLLTLGMRKFLKSDVLPKGRALFQGIRETADGIKSILAPASRGPQAKETANITRANAAARERQLDIAEEALKEAKKYFANRPAQDAYNFIDGVETGARQANPNLQSFADTMRSLLDNGRDEIRSLGKGQLENFIENYFPHIWKDPQKARDAFADMLAKRPMQGSRAFLKQRSIPTTKEGLGLGLEPVSSNPVDLTILKLAEMNKYLTAHRILGEMKEQGLLKYIKSSEKIPDGYAKIEDSVATVFGGREAKPQGGVLIRGQYVAPEPAARVLNNYLSAGIRGTAFAKPFEAWRSMGNLLNQAQLGVSFFHVGFTTVDVAVSRFAVGLEDVLRYGKPVRGLRTLLSTPASPITNLIQGSRMLSEWVKPNSQGAEIAEFVDAMVEAGGRAKQDRFYRNKAVERMREAFKEGNVIGGVLRLPKAIVEKAASPVMEYLVPRQKMGVFAEMARRELERLGPDATRAERREALAKAWDSVDNRMGQMVYDNLFWNKTAKDLAMASVRSVGWNLGSFRELVGGATDVATLPVRGIQKARGRNPDPLFTHRMAYVASLPLVVGTLGAMTTYLMTGKGPQDLKDYFYPRTGKTDENGNPERVSLPSYMKDVYPVADRIGRRDVSGAVGTFGTMASHKLHPLIGLTAEMLLNKDYYGTEIRNSDDPLMKQVLDSVKHAGETALPFSVRGIQKERERGASFGRQALPFIGITPAPSSLNKSEAVRLMDDIISTKLPSAPRKEAQAERTKLRSDLTKRARTGEDVGEEVEKSVEEGKLTERDINTISRNSERTPVQVRFNTLSLDEAEKVYAVMTKDEKAQVQEILDRKRDKADGPRRPSRPPRPSRPSVHLNK